MSSLRGLAGGAALAVYEFLLSLSPTPPAFIAAFCASFLSLICLERSSSEPRGLGSGGGRAVALLSGSAGGLLPGAYFLPAGAAAGYGFSGAASSVAFVELDSFLAFGASLVSSTITTFLSCFGACFS